eukprot:GEZU01010371.1.p1 GENE.GEZU01010371.1~~GEZU01010371.1.p1  ORF type:complete len:138 (-),score=19.98 GEZU01010371.1:100-513(-)
MVFNKSFLALAALLVVLACCFLSTVSAQCQQTGTFCVDQCQYVYCEDTTQLTDFLPTPPGARCQQNTNQITLIIDFEGVCSAFQGLSCSPNVTSPPQPRFSCVSEDEFLECAPGGRSFIVSCPAGTVCNGTAPCIND